MAKKKSILFKKIKIKIISLLKNQGFIKYSKNTIWLFIQQIVQMFFSLLVGIWVARYLRPEKYGILVYSISFVDLFSVFASLGLESIIFREIIKNEKNLDNILGTSFILQTLGAVFMFIPLSISLLLTKNDLFTNLIILIIASNILFQGFNVISFYFKAKVLNKYVVISNIISVIIINFIKIILIFIKAPLIYFAIVIVLNSLINAFCLVYFFKFKENKNIFKIIIFDKNLAKSLLKDSLFIAFSSATLVIQAKIDQVMLKEMINSTEVAYYSIALTLISFFGFIPIVLKDSLYPAIQNAKKISEDLYQKRLLNFYRLNFLVFLITAIPIYFLSKIIILFLYGKDYYAAGELLGLMAIRLFFTNMGIARGTYILTENLLKFSFFTMICGTITNIVLNYILIPHYGAKGSIVATIISFFVTTFAVDIFYNKTRGNSILMFKGILSFYRIKI